jgi:hypothetical protein
VSDARCGRIQALAATIFENAARNQGLDALGMTRARRWQWLAGAMAIGFELAGSRARQGLVKLGPHGDPILLEESGSP